MTMIRALHDLLGPDPQRAVQIEALIDRAARAVCGTIIEDQAVGDERLHEYRSLCAERAIDRQISGEARAHGLLDLVWPPLQGFARRPGFASYADLLVNFGFGFGSAALAATPADRVLGELERVVSVLDQAADPDRVTLGSEIQRFYRERRYAKEVGAIEDPNAEVELVVGGQYPYELGRLLASARRSIEIMMFFMSWGASPQHPVRELVSVLATAKTRGVGVRVLVDRDRPTDAYHSRDINRSAVEALIEAGIDVRWDSVSQLAHSKLVVVDSGATLIGSHNWTEKSFFDYQEVSLLIRSAPLARHYEAAFEQRFAEGIVPR